MTEQIVPAVKTKNPTSMQKKTFFSGYVSVSCVTNITTNGPNKAIANPIAIPPRTQVEAFRRRIARATVPCGVRSALVAEV